MLLRAVVVAIAVVIAGALPKAFGGELQTVKGTGVGRASFEECERDLPRFNKRLQKLGLVISKKTECALVDGETEAYAPAFEASSAAKLLAETAVTIYQPTRAHCERMLGDLLAGVADSDEVVLEAGCAPLTILDAEDPEKVTATFQPTVVLLKNSDDTSVNSDLAWQ